MRPPNLMKTEGLPEVPKRCEDAPHSKASRNEKGALDPFRTKCCGVRSVLASLFTHHGWTREQVILLPIRLNREIGTAVNARFSG
jgi:hypothetical protein